MDPEKRMTDLLNVTARLIDVLEREQEILKDRRHSDLALLVDEKETIGRVYQARVMGLQQDPDQLNGASDKARSQLKDMAFRVDRLMYENAHMLEAAMKVSQRVVELVAEALKDNQNPAGTYSDKGNTDVQKAALSARHSTISLDQTL